MRAVALEALQGVAKDTHLAAAIRLTGDSVFRFSDFGNERPILELFLFQARDKAEEKARGEWTFSSSAPAKAAPTDVAEPLETNINTPELKYTEVSRETLAQRLAAAGGAPTYASSQLENVNPNNPYQSQVAWATHFAKHGAEGIKEVVDKAQSGSTTLTQAAFDKLILQLNEQLSRLAEASERAAETAQSANSGAERNSMSHELRTKILWWREALYSPLLRRGYRELLKETEPPIVVAAMAFDLAQQLPALCPLSIEYLLRETVQAVTGVRSDERLTLEEALKSVINASFWFKLKSSAGVKSPSAFGRTSLLRFAVGVEDKASLSDTLPARTGIAASSEVGLDELAVWLWRDLMAERLVANRLAPVSSGM